MLVIVNNRTPIQANTMDNLLQSNSTKPLNLLLFSVYLFFINVRCCVCMCVNQSLSDPQCDDSESGLDRVYNRPPTNLCLLVKSPLKPRDVILKCLVFLFQRL